MDDDKKNNVIQLFKTHSTPTKPVQKTPRKTSPTIQVNGDHAQIAARDIHHTTIHSNKVVHKTTAKPQPDDRHINEAQIAELHGLKDEIIRLEAIAKKDPATHQRVWSALNRHMKVGAMRMIAKEDFNKARAYLNQWLARLATSKTIIKEEPETVRSRWIKYIQTNVKKLDIEDQVDSYMRKKFATVELTELELDDLKRVYNYVSNLKSRLK